MSVKPITIQSCNTQSCAPPPPPAPISVTYCGGDSHSDWETSKNDCSADSLLYQSVIVWNGSMIWISHTASDYSLSSISFGGYTYTKGAVYGGWTGSSCNFATYFCITRTG